MVVSVLNAKMLGVLQTVCLVKYGLLVGIFVVI